MVAAWTLACCPTLVESPRASKAFGRFSMSILEGRANTGKTPAGKNLYGIIWSYTDIPGRFKGARDRRLTQGNAIIGGKIRLPTNRVCEIIAGFCGMETATRR